MTKLELKNHQVWQYLTEILENLDADKLVKEHLELSDYKVCGYWDEEDAYYEEITLPHNLEAELISSSIGVTHNQRFFKLKFVIKAGNNSEDEKIPETLKIGDLILVYNENQEFVDENWVLDLDSPLLTI